MKLSFNKKRFPRPTFAVVGCLALVTWICTMSYEGKYRSKRFEIWASVIVRGMFRIASFTVPTTFTNNLLVIELHSWTWVVTWLCKNRSHDFAWRTLMFFFRNTMALTIVVTICFGLYFEKICMSRIILCIPVNAAAFFSGIQKLNQTSTLNKCYWNVVKSIRY